MDAKFDRQDKIAHALAYATMALATYGLADILLAGIRLFV